MTSVIASVELATRGVYDNLVRLTGVANRSDSRSTIVLTTPITLSSALLIPYAVRTHRLRDALIGWKRKYTSAEL